MHNKYVYVTGTVYNVSILYNAVNIQNTYIRPKAFSQCNSMSVELSRQIGEYCCLPKKETELRAKYVNKIDLLVFESKLKD